MQEQAGLCECGGWPPLKPACSLINISITGGGGRAMWHTSRPPYLSKCAITNWWGGLWVFDVKISNINSGLSLFVDQITLCGL
ncbi:hypothetical protein EYF80_006990 [Liparis tanakae]|uniref:Uncharacterized protein n=1 Tax=Liparis tanakae TaxID=230148 RepID=A0A4Z2IXN4_9TELE|nr:hypothetical protein EYF80_006990 [Liparis tanakae]